MINEILDILYLATNYVNFIPDPFMPVLLFCIPIFYFD